MDKFEDLWCSRVIKEEYGIEKEKARMWHKLGYIQGVYDGAKAEKEGATCRQPTWEDHPVITVTQETFDNLD